MYTIPRNTFNLAFIKKCLLSLAIHLPMYIHAWSLVVVTYIHTLAHALSVLDKVDMDVEFIIILFYTCVFRDRVVVITAKVVTSVVSTHVSLS